MSHNPFPGPQPYRAADRHVFYEREDLSWQIECSILANRFVTVYGPQGAGKTSVLQASVIPSLLEAHDIRVVRVDSWPEEEDPSSRLADAMYAGLKLGEREADLSAEEALLTAARRAARKSPRLVLISLDHIEQLFRPGRSSAKSCRLLEAISALAELPLRNLRIVLSLREEHIGCLRDRVRGLQCIPGRELRVRPLTVAELCRAVCQAAAAGEPPQRWDAEDIRDLMMQVRMGGHPASDDAEAQAAYAQIVCRALFQHRAPGARAAIDARRIVHSYLEITVDELSVAPRSGPS
jgi:hypothetical protein